MATYSRADRLKAIQAAGFKNPMTALAVSLAEFGENRDINAQSKSDVPNEESYGPWQIHLPSHPDVTRSCAMDLTCSTAKAYDISKGGTDFGAWSAFTNGGFARFVGEIRGLFPPDQPTEPTLPKDNKGFIPKFELPVPTRKGAGYQMPSVAANVAAGKTTSGGEPISFGLPDFFKGFTPDNLWRAGFVVLGAVMIFTGARLYLRPDAASEQMREAVHG